MPGNGAYTTLKIFKKVCLLDSHFHYKKKQNKSVNIFDTQISHTIKEHVNTEQWSSITERYIDESTIE